jgi:hypothetical protein
MMIKLLCPSERLKPIFASAVLMWALALLVHPSPASATNNCLKDEYGKSVTCSANDVSVAKALNPRALDGSSIVSCEAGSTFSFIADFQVVTTATARENIGLYFATAGQASALTGVCTDNIISPLHSPGSAGPPAGDASNCIQNNGSSLCLGSALHHEYDTSLNGDDCGDTTSADGTNQIVTVEVDNVKCQSAAGSTQLALPNCTSWQQPGGALLCNSDPNSGWPYPFNTAGKAEAIPGSPSKCNCDSTFTVPITVMSGKLGVSKTFTANGTNSLTLSGTDGAAVDYQVTVTNQSASGSITVNQICDDKYGNIATAAGVNTPCAAGSLCSTPNDVAGSTCATNIACSIPATLGTPNSSVTCTFTGTVPENTTKLQDTVTANGVDQGGNPLSNTATATVTTGDAPPQAQVIKSLDMGRECAIVRYNVEIDNKSGSTTDEQETLTALNDSQYGNITQVQGNVLGTTCGVSSGLGTLSGSTGGGAFSAASPYTIPVGGSYSCKFDAKFCGALGTAGTCSSGLEVMDTITGSLAGDEGETVSGTTSNQLTVDTCFTSSSQ